jgi:acyl carrier protein
MVSGRTILSSPAEILHKGMTLIKHVKTAEIFEKVAKIISENADIALEEIKMESDLVNDLEIDSLDFLDVAFAIDKSFGIKIPLEMWVDQVNSGETPADHYFIMANLCDRIEEILANIEK